MAHNSRYERIAQDDDAVSLQTVTQDYNYNSGVPNSPPPSFRSTTTPLTPSTLRSLNGACTDPTPPYPSTMAPSEAGARRDLLADTASWSGPADDPATTIIGLHRRLANLEESLGRLLLEREDWRREAAHARPRTNCCASLPADDTVLRDRSNCCVSVVPMLSADAQERRQKKLMGFVIVLMFLACLFVWLIVESDRKGRRA
ncbi:hypothetical protein V502_06881 [Pseudogymnoascus sp. VKM F-4520 (FW-2644)]|nr:hypothetical protein V502_06881 [Pseudogymnoascus sp. VKM F-4520 (FW-2644)]